MSLDMEDYTLDMIIAQAKAAQLKKDANAENLPALFDKTLDALVTACEKLEVITAERDKLAAQCNQLRAQLEYFIGNNFEFNEGSEYIAEDIEELLSKTPEICLSYIRANAIRQFAKETADGFSVPFVLDFAEDFIRIQAAKDGAA